MLTKRIRRLPLAILLVILAGCATYQTDVGAARSALTAANPQQAAAMLEPLAAKEGKDQLVFLLDYATALQQAGRFQESARAFGQAEKIADIEDYHSITRVASSLALSEEMVQYKGDDYEKVLINALNAINYLELGELDEALVEVRKLNQKLYRFKYEGNRDYEQNPYAYYLGAVIWEADRKWDDAYIAYKNAYELAPDFTPLHEDLIRAAIRAQRPDELAKWRKEFPNVKPKPEWSDKSMGEIVFIHQQGWGPRKQPRIGSPRFPQLFPVQSSTQRAHLVINDQDRAAAETLFSVQNVAIKTLDDDFGRLFGFRAAGVATKAVLADQLRQRNALVGQLAWLAMNLADRADLRQWSFLPATFKVARVFVKAGKYRVKAIGFDGLDEPTGEEMPEREVEVKPGRKAFVSWRSVR